MNSPAPCPFCASGEVMLCEQPIEAAAPRISHYVGCMKCLARGPQSLDKAKAVARWNAGPRREARNARA